MMDANDRISLLEEKVRKLELMIMAHRTGFFYEQWAGDLDALEVVCNHVIAEIERDPFCDRNSVAVEAVSMHTERQPVVPGHPIYKAR